MPTRAQAIVVCSCGWKVGNAARASLHEDLEMVERTLVSMRVPDMLRHWELGHEIKLGDSAPRSFLSIIATAANELKIARERAIR